MGGHAAWKKRVEAGLLAKGAGGAICRHRPHFGRKGKDLAKNRKGNIGGGNPKKKKKVTTESEEYVRQVHPILVLLGKLVLSVLTISLLGYIVSTLLSLERKRAVLQ